MWGTSRGEQGGGVGRHRAGFSEKVVFELHLKGNWEPLGRKGANGYPRYKTTL